MNILPEDQAIMAQKGHPKGLYVLFATEFWERFSYYGMRAIFVLFMTDKLLFDKAYASNIYGSYTGLVYLTPLIGGYVADRYWGNRRSIFVGGLLMAIGQFILFFCASGEQGSGGLTTTFLWAGLAFLIFGNGFFKPNISTMVGQLYPETQNTKKDSAYTIFYMGINAGAFVAPLVCGYLGENVDFKWGFFAAGVGMLISLVVFYFTKDRYVVSHNGEPLGVGPNKLRDTSVSESGKIGFSSAQIAVLLATIVGAFCLIFFVFKVDVWGSLIYSMTLVGPFAIITDRSLTKVEKSRLTVIIIIMLFVIFFWMCFEQAGASLTFFADEQTNRRVFGWEMPASYFQSFNPIFIVILAPIFASLWGVLGRKGIEPPAPMKQAMGLGFLALGFLFISFGVTDNPSVKVSILWLSGLYFLHTVGELFLSPIGLSMVNKLTPGRFTSLMMGIWFLAIATGNKLAGTMSSLYPDPKATGPKPVFLGITIDNLHTYFMIFVGFAGVAAIILFLLSFKLRKMMHGVK
ncbi:MAG TPA: peptide MFS transporter [Flavisolibacter sp.]|jgi:POT family proton-dependent oligopeptide transporter|nr:peptide MFS transporter [Flavisolibacter sp.]